MKMNVGEKSGDRRQGGKKGCNESTDCADFHRDLVVVSETKTKMFQSNETCTIRTHAIKADGALTWEIGANVKEIFKTRGSTSLWFSPS